MTDITPNMGTIAQLLQRNELRSVYQPVVRLDDRSVVGYEALMRGPENSPLELPYALLRAAAREGLSAQLQRAAVAVAVEGAMAANLGANQTLFLNIGAGSLNTRLREHDVMERAERSLRIVWEFVERSLMADPAALLAAVEDYRERYWGVALDHVGVDNSAALALLPFVRPDVIKLDLALIQKRSTKEIGLVVAAVAEHVEQNGGEVLALGIETDHHLERALTLGATLGQGWLFGRPGRLPSRILSPPTKVPLVVPAQRHDDATPFNLIAADRPDLRIGTKATLVGVSKFLESQADERGNRCILLATFQHNDHFTLATRARYARHASACALTTIFGVDVPAQPGGRTRGVPLDPSDPLAREWTVICIAPHYAAALVARDLGDAGPDSKRRFEFVLTHDRTAVVTAARSLMARVVRQA